MMPHRAGESMRSRAASASLLVACAMAASTCVAVPDALAEVSRDSRRSFQPAESNQAGPVATSSASGRRQQASVGGPFGAQPLTFCALGQVRIMVPRDWLRVARGLLNGRRGHRANRRVRRRDGSGES